LGEVEMEWKEGAGIQPEAPCPQAEVLRAEYHGAVRAYREAVIQLDAGLPGQDFELAYLRAEEARIAFAQKREELQQHLYVHGCRTSI
jgi:hypothetical protein